MNLHRSLWIFLIFAFATEIGYGQSQPTSLSLSASQGYAGVDSYYVTVGDAAGMTVDFEYSYGGSTGTFPVTLDSNGTNVAKPFTLSHDQALGTYTYLRMRNHELTEWVDPPDVTYVVLPPQPTSLSISPAAVTAGQGSYTITVGNGADINLEFQHQRNGVNQEPLIWGTLDPVSGSPADGQGAANVGSCVLPGVYTFTALRNSLNVPWVIVNSSVTINPAPPPSGSTSPSGGQRGTAVAVTIVGSHLCGAVLSTSWPGLTFSSVTPASDGTSVTAIFNVASSATLGQAVVTLTSASGSMNFNFNVQSGLFDTPGREYLHLGGRLLAVDSAIVSLPAGSPGAPAAVSAAAQSSLTINVSWTDTSINEFGFKIYWNTNGGSTFNGPIPVPANFSSYGHSGLTASTTYYYRVSAYNSAGESLLMPLTPVSATTSADVLSPPVNLVATATSTPQLQVSLTWASGGGTATSYQIERSSNNGAYQSIGTSTVTSLTDSNSLSAQTTYLYRVRAVNAGGTPSAPGNIDLATTIFFADPTLDTDTPVKAVHFTDLRTAVNAVRASAGLSPFTAWTDPVLSNSVTIMAVHIQELRDRLADALTVLGLPAPNYEDPVLTPRITPIKKHHVEQLRERVQ